MDKQLILGFANGIIEKYDIKYTDYRMLNYEFIINTLSTPFETFISANTVVQQTERKKKIPSDIEIRYEKVCFYKNQDIIKEVYIKNVSFVNHYFIGTKKGRVIYKDESMKVTDEPIILIKKRHHKIHCYTSNKEIVIFRKKSVNTNFQICGKIITNNKITEIIDSKNYTTIYKTRSNNLYFREITCSIFYNDLLIIGTKENKIALLENDKLIDVLNVEGSVSSICKSKKHIYCATMSGLLYVLVVFNNQLFIKYQIRNQSKITACYYSKNLYFLDSSGDLKRYNYKLRQIEHIFSFQKYLSCLVIKDTKIYCAGSGGIFILYDIVDKEVSKYYIQSSSISALVLEGNNLYLGGDSHCIYKFDLRSKSYDFTVGHSSPINYITVKKHIFTISNDNLLKVWTKNLELKSSNKIFIENPTSLNINNGSCYVFGNGIQKINIHD